MESIEDKVIRIVTIMSKDNVTRHDFTISDLVHNINQVMCIPELSNCNIDIVMNTLKYNLLDI